MQPWSLGKKKVNIYPHQHVQDRFNATHEKRRRVQPEILDQLEKTQ
jgi:hypothetical protein